MLDDSLESTGSISSFFYGVVNKKYTDDDGHEIPKGWFYKDQQKGSAPMEMCYTMPHCNWFMTKNGTNYYYNRPLPKRISGDELSDTFYGIKNVRKFLSELKDLTVN
jgi:hypothetical protein